MQPLIFSHDGGVDDYVALALLAAELTGPARSTHTLLGVIVTGADCFLEPALAATASMLALHCRDAAPVPLVRSTVRGANAFPHEWRSTSVVVAHLPILLRAGGVAGAAAAVKAGGEDAEEAAPASVVSSTGPRWLADTLMASPVPVDIIETGPLTTVAEALALNPACAAKIGRLCWMGGALRVRGNVSGPYEPCHDGSAEWNAYWDAAAVTAVLAAGLGDRFQWCALDVTNSVPVSKELRARVAAAGARSWHVDLVAQLYALEAALDVYAWDVLTVGLYFHPEFFTLERVAVRCVDDLPSPSYGRTVVDEERGHAIGNARACDADAFRAYLIDTLAGAEGR